MQTTRHDPIPLSSIQVRWSARRGAFVAWSEEHPELTHTDPWSSLAAMDGLMEAASTRTGVAAGESDSLPAGGSRQEQGR